MDAWFVLGNILGKDVFLQDESSGAQKLFCLGLKFSSEATVRWSIWCL